MHLHRLFFLCILQGLFTNTEYSAQNTTDQFWAFNHDHTHNNPAFPLHRLQEKQQINSVTTSTTTKNRAGSTQHAIKPKPKAITYRMKLSL